MYTQAQYSPLLHEKVDRLEKEGDGDVRDSHSDALMENDLDSTKYGRPRTLNRRHVLPWVLLCLNLIVCLGLFVYVVSISKGRGRDCINRSHAYCEYLDVHGSQMFNNDIAPLLEGLDEKYQDVRFKYSLWYQSPFKGPPTPEVEDAWQDIMRCESLQIHSKTYSLSQALTFVQMVRLAFQQMTLLELAIT